MLCDDCGHHEAVVHIVQIGPQGRVEKNLCEKCAAGYGELMPESQPRKNMSVDDFLRGMFRQPAEQGEKPKEREGEPLVLTCPNCGMSYEGFQQTGKIGCSVCYGTFRRQLEPLLRRIHGTSTHSGKIPRRSGGTLELKQEIKRLRAELQEKVAQEEYEEAAKLRDKVRAMERELSAKEGGEAHVQG
jgi:protein arginine kinase activator